MANGITRSVADNKDIPGIPALTEKSNYLSVNGKICVFTSTHLENDVRIYKKQIISLLNHGYKIYYCTNKENLNIDKKHLKNAEVISHPNLKIFYNKNFNEDLRLKRFLKSIFFFMKLPKDSSVYHFHDPDLLFSGLILKMLGKKVIYDVHENYKDSISDKEYLPKYIRNLISILVSTLETFCCFFFDLIICATPNIEERFKKSGIKRTVVINNYPYKTEFMKAETTLIEKENVVLYAGGITQKRGISSLIKSIYFVNKKTNCTLKMAGQIHPTTFEKLLMSLTGWENVKYLGILKRSDLATELNKAKIGAALFLPEKNHINAQPNKIFEYMSACLPVVTSNFPLWREIVEKNNCGICVDPENPSEVANAILRILSDDSLAKTMGENGKKSVDTKYNWEIEEIKLIDAYSKLFT